MDAPPRTNPIERLDVPLDELEARIAELRPQPDTDQGDDQR